MQTIPANFQIEDGKQLNVSITDSKRWVINFVPLGSCNPRQPESLDAIDLICEFTTAESFLLKVVKQQKEDDNTLTIRRKSFSLSDQAKLKTAIPSWIKKGLLVRTKREYYMVNPWFWPPRQEQLRVIDHWKALNHKC